MVANVAQRAARIARVAAERRLLVPVDIGKYEAMALVADASGERLVSPSRSRWTGQG